MSLLEVLVVLGIISILAGILFPTAQKAKRRANRLLTCSNQRQIVQAAIVYTVVNNDSFPDSVATIGSDWYWNWSEPTLMTGRKARSPQLNRSMSAYLGEYINDVSIMACPNAPEKNKNLQKAWHAQDDWDDPETWPVRDPLSGNYCFYWNYTGYLEGRDSLFNGPSTSAGDRRESKLLVSDYFGYDHWRSQNAYGSCEQFKNARITPGTIRSSSYWSDGEDSVSLETIAIRLQAGFTDGHVESYSAANVVPMRVILNVAADTPYPNGIGPGIYYLPAGGL